MKLLAKRLLKLEVGYAARTNDQGLTPADVLRQRTCRRLAQDTGRPYEELVHESMTEEKEFWKTYDGDRSIAGVLRSRYQRGALTLRPPG